MLPGESALRSELIDMAAQPFFQHDVDSIADLRKKAVQMRRQDHRHGNPQYNIRSEKEIRQLLSVVGN